MVLCYLLRQIAHPQLFLYTSSWQSHDEYQAASASLSFNMVLCNLLRQIAHPQLFLHTSSCILRHGKAMTNIKRYELYFPSIWFGATAACPTILHYYNAGSRCCQRRASMAVNISLLNVTLAAAIHSSSWSLLVTPMMVLATRHC